MERSVRDAVISEHAAEQMQRRQVELSLVQEILQRPEQREEVRPGRILLQSRASLSGKDYLIRLFVDVDRVPPEVVTVYRTSKISKYWRA